MRKSLICIPMILLLLLTGCGGQGNDNDALASKARTDYLSMQRCAGTVDLHADYGERVYDYTIAFTQESGGETVLQLTAPAEVAGVSARIAQGETRMEFDGVALETGALSADGLAPIDAIPLVLDYLREGYIAETGGETLDDVPCLRLQFREPETTAGTGREAAIWLHRETHALVRAELMQDGFTVIRLHFNEFTKE